MTPSSAWDKLDPKCARICWKDSNNRKLFLWFRGNVKRWWEVVCELALFSNKETAYNKQCFFVFYFYFYYQWQNLNLPWTLKEVLKWMTCVFCFYGRMLISMWSLSALCLHFPRQFILFFFVLKRRKYICFPVLDPVSPPSSCLPPLLPLGFLSQRRC